MLIKVGDNLFRILELHHLTPGNKRAHIQVRMRNIRTQMLADVLGRPLLADFEVDSQLQRGILKLLEDLKVDPRSVPAYAPFADRKFLPPKADEDGDAGPPTESK